VSCRVCLQDFGSFARVDYNLVEMVVVVGGSAVCGVWWVVGDGGSCVLADTRHIHTTYAWYYTTGTPDAHSLRFRGTLSWATTTTTVT
jgi:hypothetical protein